MPHPLQMLHVNHSYVGESQAQYQGNEIGGKSDRLGSQFNWSMVRMSFNICGRETYIFLNKIPVSTIKLPE